MKTYLCLLIAGLIVLPGCKNGESTGSLPSSSKLLAAIKQNNHLITEFKYDSLNRLTQLNNYLADTISYNEFYQYDLNNKLIKRTYSGFIENYEYSGDGKLNTMIKDYNATQKEWKIVYQYDDDKISKGITYFNDSETGYIGFKYDSNGNTIERTEYPNWATQDFIDTQFKLTYDSKINPVINRSIFPGDVVQNNNPIYFYHYMSVMSIPPPEYHSNYDYDTAGLPVKEYRGSQIFDYEYIDKK